jgi:ubiquitin-protein ligase
MTMSFSSDYPTKPPKVRTASSSLSPSPFSATNRS